MDKINIPAWNHFPFLGYLHYKNTTAIKFVHKPQKLWLPPSQPISGVYQPCDPCTKRQESRDRDQRDRHTNRTR